MLNIRDPDDAALISNSHPLREWLQILARPVVYRMLTRTPTSEHLLKLLEAYRPFAETRARDAEATRLELSRLTEQLRDWASPDLPVEIVDTARRLLRADGLYAILDWEMVPRLDPGQAMDDLVIWPPWEPTRPKAAL
ncbi:MAG: hypothetical protein ABJE95_14770 [Byssovorax sp.]